MKGFLFVKKKTEKTAYCQDFKTINQTFCSFVN